MLGIGKVGWVEKDAPVCGPLDAIVRSFSSFSMYFDIHIVWEGATGERNNDIRVTKL